MSSYNVQSVPLWNPALQTGMDKASAWVRLAAMFPPAHGLIRLLANTFPDEAQTRSVQGREVRGCAKAEVCCRI
jgi:hypothetical protein